MFPTESQIHNRRKHVTIKVYFKTGKCLYKIIILYLPGPEVWVKTPRGATNNKNIIRCFVLILPIAVTGTKTDDGCLLNRL